MAEKKAASPGVRMLIDYGPLAVFFLVNALAHGPVLARVFAATVAFMVAMAAAMRSPGGRPAMSRRCCGSLPPSCCCSAG
jgi:hypothetical protein